MIPQFVRAGKRGGPLSPAGSSKVSTDVRPYRVSSGTLRIVVRFLDIDVSRQALPLSAVKCAENLTLLLDL